MTGEELHHLRTSISIEMVIMLKKSVIQPELQSGITQTVQEQMSTQVLPKLMILTRHDPDTITFVPRVPQRMCTGEQVQSVLVPLRMEHGLRHHTEQTALTVNS